MQRTITFFIGGKKKLSVEVCQLEIIIINAERTFEKVVERIFNGTRNTLPETIFTNIISRKYFMRSGRVPRQSA